MTRAALLAGVDEVGRGPLAGAVVAAAVILDQARPLENLRDSKKFSHARRLELEPIIKREAVAWAIGRAEVHEIDELNILQATMLAMRRAVLSLSAEPEQVLVDGNRVPDIPYATEAIVKGDQKIDAIMAASIIAKVHRDREMMELDQRYPGYGFAKHKGYGTAFHLAALRDMGPCDIHRKTFAPVRNMIS